MNLFEFDMKELEVNCMGIALRVILPKVGRQAFSKFCVFFLKKLDWSLQRYVGKCVVEKNTTFPEYPVSEFYCNYYFALPDTVFINFVFTDSRPTWTNQRYKIHNIWQLYPLSLHSTISTFSIHLPVNSQNLCVDDVKSKCV